MLCAVLLWPQYDVNIIEAADLAEAAAGDAAADLDGDLDAKALREMLKRRDAARRAAEEDLAYDEIPQPDEGDEPHLD